MGALQKKRFALTEVRSLEAFLERCRKSGMRIGRPRRLLAEIMIDAEDGFDFDTLWDRVGWTHTHISHGTIYLTLRRFRQAGLIDEAADL